MSVKHVGITRLLVTFVMATEYIFLAQVLFYLIPLTKAEHVLNALETPIREAQLRPRNFNPHPYFPYDISESSLYGIQAPFTSGLDNSVYDAELVTAAPNLIRQPPPANGIYSQGPVQFPPQDTNDIADPRKLPHPYATFKSRVNSARNRNLAIAREYENESTTQKQYAFSYTVRDSKSGDDFSHSQQQKNGAVHGTYKVQLPDGRVQVVKYTADSNGYRADVSYTNGGSTDDVRAVGPTAQSPAFVDKPFRHSYFGREPNNYVDNDLVADNEQSVQHSYETARDDFQPHVNLNHHHHHQHHHHQRHHQFHNNLAPTPPSSSIFVSTVQPLDSSSNALVEVAPPQSIGAQYSPAPASTYVVSRKSTQVQDSYDYDLDYDYDKNAIVQRSAPSYSNSASNTLNKEPQQALYFKTK